MNQDPRPIDYEGVKYGNPELDKMPPDPVANPFIAQQEMLNLQMPDHRRAVNVVGAIDQRPESKKGFDSSPLGTSPDTSETKIRGKNQQSGMRKDVLGPAPHDIMDDDQYTNEMDNIEEPVPIDHDSYMEDPGREVQNYENFESFEERKDKFNLEDALEIEKHLLKISESLRKQEDPTAN
eukprot:CAMPEP_0197019082 /NCGR_PEP_ID=MMETSP1380-20130617/80481_1 /TAXON_ID=5936 /ORGANISM="Euplotes crassus, Strain CT5" /LENGTH=179 /DNA_ID=CAMNT_0042446417 /DNA_START=15 /DNA_END=554 /DNA_ORIENTATION=-